jgi:hypothetical protein
MFGFKKRFAVLAVMCAMLTVLSPAFAADTETEEISWMH